MLKKLYSTALMASIVVISAIAFMLPLKAHAYYVYGKAIAKSYMKDTTKIEDWDYTFYKFDDESSLESSIRVSTDAGQSAEAKYFTNLGTGLLGTYIEALDLDPDASESAFGAASYPTYALSETKFGDTLSFQIPDGVYEHGLSASLTGYISGNLHAQGYIDQYNFSYAEMHGNFYFGGDAFRPVWKAEGFDTISIDQEFTLVADLVDNGSAHHSPAWRPCMGSIEAGRRRNVLFHSG
ncbi:MAG: hypothetical protein R6U22_11085, partial [Desulfohalobiaceae bacterium]